MTMKTIAGAAAMVAVAGMMAGCCQECGKKEVKMYTNNEFYAGGSFDADGINKDGKFDAAKGKEAYFDLMRRFGYPVFPSFKDDKLTNPKDGSQYLGFWATDFAKGDFMKFGMGGVIWVDEIKEEYFGHDIFLLPFQSIAEHSHVAGSPVDKSVSTDRWTGEVFNKNIPAKMESWLVRHGWVWGFTTEGEPNLDKYPEVKAKLSALLFEKDPKTGKQFLNCVHVEKWTADGVAHKLAKDESWHFMMGGDEGAIVSEFANYHDGQGLRFSVPGVGF